MLSCATTIAPSFWNGPLPPVWSPWKWVLIRYLIGSGEILVIAALILSCSGANWPSTMMMPSVPTATVMLPPSPSRRQVLWPRSIVLICVFEKSRCCAPAGPARQKAHIANAANATRFMTCCLDFCCGPARPGRREDAPGGRGRSMSLFGALVNGQRLPRRVTNVCRGRSRSRGGPTDPHEGLNRGHQVDQHVQHD